VNIDIHAHLFPPSAMHALRAGRSWHGSTLETGPRGNPVIVTDGRRRALGADSHLITAAERIGAMDRMGVDIQILSLVPLLFGYDLDHTEAVGLARDTNDEIKGCIDGDPGRFLGLGGVPAQRPDAAVAELERVMATPGFVGITLGTNVSGRAWDDPALFPILEAAERLDAYVFFHPVDVRGREVLSRYYLHNLLGNPLETTMAVAALVFGGVLDRLPRLRLGLAHGGGYIAFAIGRLDHGNRVRPEARDMRLVPSDYLRRFHVDALTHSPGAVRYLVDVMGVERVVMGSDFPADMGPADPVGDIRRDPHLDGAAKAAILGGNLMRDLRLDRLLAPTAADR
jgi:aminocarboxymuconate-semialdehyde decarboxylase